MIFNSLGSNYDWKYIFKSLSPFWGKESEKSLKKHLAKEYSGEVTLLYKGREAIKLALIKMAMPAGTEVGITGFTCYVVYQAVVEAGYKPVLIDVTERTLNFDVNRVRKFTSIKILILQNTLGNTSRMDEVINHCRKNHIIIIEDLAHSAGLRYSSGEMCGLVGDFVALSFSQDKAIDAVSGGALIVRNKRYKKIKYHHALRKVPFFIRIKDRLYPILTYLIRKTYPLYVGKILHFILKEIRLLSDPVGESKSIILHNLPSWYCSMVLYQMTKMQSLIDHRKKIVKIYSEIFKGTKGVIRYPMFINQKEKLIENLRKHGIHISDTWYDAPVSPKKVLNLTTYRKGECPISENISGKLINLPTHININEKQARGLGELVSLWTNTH